MPPKPDKENKMKKPAFAFATMVSDRSDGAPVDYARTRGELEDRLASTDIMLAIAGDESDDDNGFDPYNTAGA